jgi:hypothetical protein
VEIRLSRAEAALYPPIKGTLASLTGISVGQINADLLNTQYSPYQPAPIMTDASASIVEFIKLHPSEFPGVSVLDVATRSYPNGGNVGPRCWATSARSPGRRSRPIPTPATRPTR